MRKTIRTLLRSGLLAGALFALSVNTYAQYTVSLTANPGTTGNGPMGSSNYHASEHIYLASEIGTDLNITQIGFAMNALTGLPKTYNSVSIYLQTTANTTFVSGLYSTAGYTLVYSGPITFPSAIGFTDVTLTTPFNYTLAAGNLQMLVVRTDNVTAAGPVMNSANGNSTLATASTCRRYNGTGVPTIGVTTLAITAFRAAVKFSSSAGSCAAFPANFSQTAFHCYQLTPSYALLQRNAANGFAAAGTGSVLLNFFNLAAATTSTIFTPVFTPYGVLKQLNFDVAGATYPANAPDQIFVEGSTNGGATWTVPIATLDNSVGGALNPTGLSQTAGYVPTTAAEWATRSYNFPGTVNRIRWRAISQFGNQVYLDNITVTNPPACPTPINVAIGNVTGFNANVSWTCASCTGSFIIEYGAPGFTPGTGATAGGGGTVVTAASSPATITVPLARTNYNVYVRQNCGGGNFSANTVVTNFLSGCGAALACNYDFHLTDNYGDSWNGALVEVRENGLLVGSLGPQVATCDANVVYELCDAGAISLICTNPGAFPDEPGLTMSDPFGGVVYEFRGPSTYPGNCPIFYPTPGSLSNLTAGTLHAGVVDCVQDPCTNPPVAGTLQANATNVCAAGGSVGLHYAGGSNGSGQTLTWESSVNGTTWATIPGSTPTITHSPTDTTYYRVIVTCGAGTDTSNVVVVNANTFLCYCTATHSVGCGNGDIVNVTLNTLNNTTTCSAPAYTAYGPSGTTTTTVQQGVGYNMSVTTDQGCIISVWVDWDHNGVYNTNEWSQVSVGSVANAASTINLAVPLGATLGATNMRVRSRFTGNANGAANACGNFGSGEAEDYIINVAPAPPCLPATSVAFSSVNTNGFTVNWSNGVNSCGTATYSVEYGPAGFVQGSGTTLAPVTAGPVVIGGLTAVTQYDVYVTRDCTPCGDGPGVSSFGQVVTYPDCAAAPAIVCPSGIGSFGPNGPGGWNFVEPTFNFTTSGKEQLFFLNASVLGTYSMSLTAAAGSSRVAVYFKAVGACDPTGWTHVGTNQFTVQSFTFPVATTGQYWVLVDPVSASLPINTYGVTFVCPVQNIDCASAEPIACGAQVQSSTSGLLNSLPLSACAFSEAPSSGGSVWYSYTNTVAQEVTATTCGTAQFDTRISIFQAAPDCDNLVCVAQNDDGTGCPNFSSEVSWAAAANVQYYIVVHGYGADEGIFQMNVFCTAPCAPAVPNDACGNAVTLIPALDDGSGVSTSGDNSCAHSDQFTSCDGFGALQGMWYSFNSGPNALMFMDLALGSAGTMNYALYNGACSGLGATGEVDCVIGGEGLNTQLPALTTNTDYLLYLWNDGGVGQEGDFTVLLRHPALNDAAVDTILDPSNALCSTTIDPRIVIRNNGELNLTSAVISYRIDAGTPLVYNWSGDLAYQETDTVTLPTISSPSLGVHTLHVSSSLPNGSADGLTANDAVSKVVNITGETVVVAILTDNNGGQTTWAIANSLGETMAAGGPYTGQNNAQVNTNVCLSTNQGNCFSFYLFDSGGDGLLGAGQWELRNAQGRSVLRDNGQYTSTSPVSPPGWAGYGDNHAFCLPGGPSAPLPTECGIFTNLLADKVYCNTVLGVTNYQFEFSNPNGGWARRIAVARNYVQFGEMVTTPLVYGTTYFCRVRVDQGAAGFSDDRFGTGCEMALNAVQPACTALISLPGNTYSCGVTKRFRYSDKIYAQPVNFATQYRFRFEGGLIDIDGPNPNLLTDTLGVDNVNDPPVLGARNTILPTYVCTLSWVQWQLVSGQTYQVKVEAFVNGVWRGYCGATCNVTIQNPPESGRMPEEVLQTSAELFPNPVNDGLVNLQLSGLADTDHNISVEMFDVFGKRVMAQDHNVAGETFRTVLELDGNMAAGIYMVNITVDGVTTTKRLSVL